MMQDQGILPEDMGWRPPKPYTRSLLPAPESLDTCLLGRLAIGADSLEKLAPPKFHHPHKQMLYQVALQRPCQVIVTRWSEWPISSDSLLPRSAKITVLRNAYTYDTSPSTDRIDWHVNFADPNVFVAYSGPLFAQDEIQVMEHPTLASVREYLLDKKTNANGGLMPRTRLDGRPTPVLISGVQRKLHIVLDGIYGNHFACTPREQIRKQTTAIENPTITNFICMAAMSRGSGYYQEGEILYHLTAAYTAFSAANSEPKHVVVHTGNWGCGAYGGNRTLMALIQIIAAHYAGIDELVYHAFDQVGVDKCNAALQLMDARLYSLKDGSLPFSAVCSFLRMQNYKWGIGDGN